MPVSNVATGGNVVWFGPADSAFIDVYSLRGKYLRSVALGVKPRRATQAHKDRALDRVLLNLADERTREINRQYYRRFPLPEYLPSYDGMVADPAGNVWAVLSSEGDSITVLRGLSPDGDVLGDLLVPVPMKVFEVGTDYVLGAYIADGSPHVVMYKLPAQR